MGIAGNQEKGDDEPNKKAQPLFTRGTGKKRLFGVSLWNKAGLEHYYTAEENWWGCLQFERNVLEVVQ